MSDIYRFLASYEALIYILLAIGGLFAFRWLWNSWREWQGSVYKLEREFSMRRLGQSAAAFILILILFCVEFFMASFVIPGLPADVFLSTPTIDLLATPTGTLSAEMMTQFASQPSPFPGAASLGCIPNQVILTSPEPGQEVQGTIELIGTVNIPSFGFYKYEVAPQGSDTWATISAGREVVINGTIGRWDTTALTPGDYQLRLVVTDNEGKSLSPCIVPVRVMSPQ
jgi:hypothetical protein